MVPVASQEPYAAPTTAPHSNDTTNGNAKSPSTKVTVLCDTPQLRCWMTTIRDARTQGPEFARAVGQVSRMLMYEGTYYYTNYCPLYITRGWSIGDRGVWLTVLLFQTKH